jgi:excisionase family DNA binding protein
MTQITSPTPPAGVALPPVEVLTLAEAAEYLRVSEAEVLDLIQNQGLPSRKVGAQWRFLKAAIQDWLRVPEKGDFWSRNFGALKGDPYLEEILERVDRERKLAEMEE